MTFINRLLVFAIICIPGLLIGQNLHYFFVDNIYQRSYFNPALNDKGKISIASGPGTDIYTNGPSIDDITSKNPAGGLIVSSKDALEKMNVVNDIYGYTSINTLDGSIQLPFGRISVGHAWKSQGWMQYTKDLAEFVTHGNGAFVGQTLELSPQIDYINYNEIYIGLQKAIGPLSVGARIKQLSGVEAIKTENHKIDLTTSDDIYQLTLENDFELNSSNAFYYTDLENFDLNVQNLTFDNILTKNTGWAFDIGASLRLNESIEISLSVVDWGSINWTVDPKNYTAKNTQTFDGIDVSEYITSDSDFVLLDSLESLLDLEETNKEFKTTLPTKIYLGGKIKLNDLWSVGALVHSNGSGDRRANVIAFNATANLYSYFSAGVMYSLKSGNPSNMGLFLSMKVGPITGFLSSDNIFRLGTFKSTNSNLRAGVSFRI